MSRLRHRGSGRRSRRLRSRAVRGIGGTVGGDGREAQGGWHLPAPRLHPGQGPAARRGGVPDGRPCRRRRGHPGRGLRARAGLAGRQQAQEPASSTSCTEASPACSSGARCRSSSAWARSPPSGAVSVDGQTLTGKATIICTGSVPRAIPGMDIDGERIITSDHAHQQRRRQAAGAGRGHRRWRHRRRVRLGLHRPRRGHDAAGGPADGVLPIGPDRDIANVLASSLAKRGTKIHAEARVGSLETHQQRRPRAVRDPQGHGEDRGRPGSGVDRAAAGQRGHRRRRGRGQGDRPRIHRGRHRPRC